MREERKIKPGIKLYSLTFSMILMAFLAWMSDYEKNPTEPDVASLQKIANSLAEYQNSQSREEVSAGEVMAWIYPGKPACSANAEVRSMKIDTVKPEYFIVLEGGKLDLMTEEKYGCNGFSLANVKELKNLSKNQYVTVSANYSVNIKHFLENDKNTGVYSKTLVDFVVNNNLTGIELDFEDFGGFDANLASSYLAFVEKLGYKLHEHGKKLMVDLPAVRNKNEEGWYRIKYSDFNQLPVDYLVIMAYDYQYDHGVGQPVSPLFWLREVAAYAKTNIHTLEKIVIGLPLYAYEGDMSSRKINLLTIEQASFQPLWTHLVRDEGSKELIAKRDEKVLVVQDKVSLEEKIKTVKEAGINKVSLWHLGGSMFK